MPNTYETDIDQGREYRTQRLERASTSVSARIFLADDHEEIIRVVTLVLADTFEIVGVSADGEGVLARAPTLLPDVIIVDICMPKMNGIETALRLKALGSGAKIVFLTIHQDPDFVELAMSSGAVGYVLKPCLCSDLVPAIRAALDGVEFVSPCVHEQGR